jgi:hypothetical protein
LLARLSAARGQALNLIFIVKVDADYPFGLNISNWPEGYDARGAKPVEVEIRYKQFSVFRKRERGLCSFLKTEN